MNCPQCGFSNTETAGFCISCGNSLAMAHIIRDEDYISDLVRRIDRLEALLEELGKRPVEDRQALPPIQMGIETESSASEQTSGIVEDLTLTEHIEASLTSPAAVAQPPSSQRDPQASSI